MLSYRHGFHAGNFADVLKHITLLRIVDYLAQKEPGLCLIDTHAGAGVYALTAAYAQKNREHEQGIAKLWPRTDCPAPVARYLDMVKAINPGASLDAYPGSPWLLRHCLREQDRLVLFERHPADAATLAATFAKHPRIRIVHGDGLGQSIPLLPPPERRGLVFIDPSYELKTDYRQVVDSLAQMHRRFATGCYALWYPVVERAHNHKLEKRLRASGIKNIQLFELALCQDHARPGMTACGMIVINPPWTLMAAMRQTLPWLAQTLADDGHGHRIGQLADE